MAHFERIRDVISGPFDSEVIGQRTAGINPSPGATVTRSEAPLIIASRVCPKGRPKGALDAGGSVKTLMRRGRDGKVTGQRWVAITEIWAHGIS